MTHESYVYNFKGAPTAPRYELNHSEIRRTDFVSQDGYKNVRKLEYIAYSAENNRYRDEMAGQGLVLGRLVAESPKSGKSEFAIPSSARPIKHDAPASINGAYFYSDADRFRDLGEMLKSLALTGDTKVPVLQKEIGCNIAEVEFTRLHDRRLFFVPGFEQFIEPTEQSHEDVLAQYVTRLSQEFGARFDPYIDQFAEGFDK
jgi:hypothetical protein